VRQKKREKETEKEGEKKRIFLKNEDALTCVLEFDMNL